MALLLRCSTILTSIPGPYKTDTGICYLVSKLTVNSKRVLPGQRRGEAEVFSAACPRDRTATCPPQCRNELSLVQNYFINTLRSPPAALCLCISVPFGFVLVRIRALPSRGFEICCFSRGLTSAAFAKDRNRYTICGYGPTPPGSHVSPEVPNCAICECAKEKKKGGGHWTMDAAFCILHSAFVDESMSRRKNCTSMV
jgi:hypothetical protein